MVSTQAMRDAWRDYLCIADHPDRRAVTILGRNAGFCPPEMIEPFHAMSRALVSTGYQNAFDVWVPRKCSIGIKGRPCKSDGTNCSLHNYGVAVDIDPPTPAEKVVRNGTANPMYGPEGHWKFGDIKLTQVQVEAVVAIRNTGGARLFQWLGDSTINDTMHFEVQVPPKATAVDWETVAGGGPGVPLPVVNVESETVTATYVVQPNDTMVLIATRFELSVSRLKAANPQVQSPFKIFPGQAISIPGSIPGSIRGSIPGSSNGSTPDPAAPAPTTGQITTYIIQPADTMVKIAGRFGVTALAMVAANPHIPDPAKIFPGQVLTIPVG